MNSQSTTSHSYSDKLQALADVLVYAQGRDINEAETRHKVIDFILHDFLSWPKNRVTVESYIDPGFADYVLKKSNNDDLLFIEAKRAGVFFELPIPHATGETSCFIGLKKLMSDSSVAAAITQVRTYCFNSGCEFACVTNGFEWIFFKTFEKGKR